MHKIGVFGAAFNPPTLGHRDVILQAQAHFDEILLIPAISHAFGKTLLSFSHRLRMLDLFIGDLPKANFPPIRVSRIEEILFEQKNSKGPIYTYDVMQALDVQYREAGKAVSLRFMLGPDNSVPDVWKKFYRYEQIEKQWPLFIAKENVAIHSTLVREVCATMANDKQRFQALTDMVGEKIANYIEENHLYRERESRYG